MPRRAARFFRFSLSLSLSLPLSVSLLLFPLSVLCLTFLPSYLPSTYLPLTPYSSTSLSATMFSLRTAQPVQVCLAFYYFPFQSSIKDTPPLPIDISCIIFFLRPIPHSCYLPNFPTLFAGTIVSLLFSISIIFYPSFRIYVAYLMMRFTSLCSVALRPLLSRAPPSQQDVCTELRIAFTTHRLSG